MCLINTSSDCHHLNVFLDVFVGFGQWRWYPFYICTLVCLFQTTNALSTSAKHVHTEIDNAIHRLNYGTIFKSMGNLHFSREYWLQTFQIPIPDRITYPKGFSVNKQACTKLNCQFFQSLLDQIHGIQVETYNHVNRTLHFLKSVIPYHKIEPRRKTRSLLPFVGSLSKSLFGTATMDDVNILASHINALTKTSNNIVNALQKHNEHITSFMSTSNKRMDNLQFGISNNFKAINQLSKTFFFNLQHLELVIENTTGILINQLDTASQLRAEFDNLHGSILALIQGKLTPHLISKQNMQHSISEIQKLLSHKEPHFYLSQKQLNWYYQKAKFFYVRHKSSLYITVKFPLTSQRLPLSLYKVISYPVPINSTSSHATSLLNLPTYFAVTSHQQFYTTFTVAEIATCQNDDDIHCTFNKALTPVTSPSCIIGLFANNKKWIKDFCHFRFLQNAIKSDIIELSSTSVLAYNTWNIDMNCPNKQQILKGCKFCILHIPCRCTLTTNSLFYSPRLVDCHKTLENITISHPVNLALLHEFFSDSSLKSILGDTTFLDPIQVNLPNFKIYSHDYNQFLAADQKAHLNLTKMVNVAKKDQIIFKSLAEPLLEGNIAIDSSWPTVSDIVDFVALGIAILAILGFIFMFFKVRKILAIISILQQVKQVKSESALPSFVYKPFQPATSSPTEFESLLQEFSWNHASVLLSSIVISVLFVFSMYHWFSKRNLKCTQIILELTTGGECVLVPVLTLPLCPSFWQIDPPSQIHSISVNLSLFASKMFINWSDFSVTNIKGTRAINVKSQIKLDLYTAYKAKRITEQPFDVHILISHHGLYQPLPHFGTFIVDSMNFKEHSP